MKTLPIILLCFALASCAVTKPTVSEPVLAKAPVADPIDTLVKRLHAGRGFWQNGGSPKIDLPQDAEPEEVIAAAIRWQSFDQGMIKSYQIDEIRYVDLWDFNAKKEQYTIALLKTEFGPKAIVFNFKTFDRWWARFYPVIKEQQNK